MLTAIDLFSGLGGWAIAGHATGIRTACFVENDKRCQAFLSKAWPGIPIHGDIKEFDGRQYAGADIVFGGVPCQPASRAGRRKGAADDRWLWPEALRVVAEARPRCCLFENPPGIGDLGLDGILAALEGQGYEIAPVFDIPACAVDSPQLRHRYYIVAFARLLPREQDEPQRGSQGGIAARRPGENVANGPGPALERPDAERGADGRGAEHSQSDVGGSAQRRQSWPQSGGSETYGPGSATGHWGNYVWLPCADRKVRRAPDDSVGLVDGLHRSLLGALGNSQVPQVAEIFCRAIGVALKK